MSDFVFDLFPEAGNTLFTTSIAILNLFFLACRNLIPKLLEIIFGFTVVLNRVLDCLFADALHCLRDYRV